MFDISWTEFLLIGVVALVVIGPKELPAVLRTLGQWTRRARSMAADFQSQFQEAMREAEMADLKKQVDDIAHGIKSYDPLKDVRADVEAAGKDIQSSIEQKPALMTESRNRLRRTRSLRARPQSRRKPWINRRRHCRLPSRVLPCRTRSLRARPRSRRKPWINRRRHCRLLSQV